MKNIRMQGELIMLLITHALSKNLLVDEVVRIGVGSLAAVAQAAKDE